MEVNKKWISFVSALSGSSHAQRLDGGEITNATLTAVCDLKPERLEWAKKNLSDRVECFDSDESFFANAKIDAVLVAVPHYGHPGLCIEGMKRGLHVLCEKPAGV